MRILHTSDWHLGRTFGPLSLEADQRAFLTWLVEVVHEYSVDLVVIAGDIYDRAIAPNDSLVLFRDTLHCVRAAGAQVVAITGNHDGADRVSPYDTLVDASGVFIRGGYTRPGEVIRLEAADGPLDVVALPFLEPQMAPDDFDVGDGPAPITDVGTRRQRRTHQSVLQRAVDLARPALSATRSLAVAHAFVAGGAESESERQLTVGGTGQVDPSVFAGFSYVALGHLHRPQTVGAEHIRYSGTPLAYSFSETHDKSVTIVEMDATGHCDLTSVPVPVGRRVSTLTGTLDELCGIEPSAALAESFIRAVITDPAVVLDAKSRLVQRYPYVVEIELRPAGRDEMQVSRPAEIAAMTPLHAARRFWAEITSDAPSAPEDQLLIEALEYAQNQTTP